MENIIYTKRLKIYPLSLEVLMKRLEIADDENIKRALSYQIDMLNKSPEKLIWYTMWEMIDTETNSPVGMLCYKSEPDENKNVEIGYGTSSKHENKGYMTEAVKEFVSWTFRNTEVEKVLAETNIDNIPSQKILINSKMTKYKEDDKLYYWQINKADWINIGNNAIP